VKKIYKKKLLKKSENIFFEKIIVMEKQKI
jgi:hypothetical protein